MKDLRVASQDYEEAAGEASQTRMSDNNLKLTMIVIGLLLVVVFLQISNFQSSSKSSAPSIQLSQPQVQSQPGTQSRPEPQTESGSQIEVWNPDPISLKKSLQIQSNFNHKYSSKQWDKTGKHPSGLGSIPSENMQYLLWLQYIIDRPKIHKIVEMGFGDAQMLNQVHIPPEKKYFGYDVVESLMLPNTSNMFFRLMGDVHEWKESGDLLITRDVIQHWPNQAVDYFFTDVVPRFKYVLLCIDERSYGEEGRPDIKYSNYAGIDMSKREPKQLLSDTWIQSVKKSKKTFIIPQMP